jgi:hypothetical protein
MRKTKTHMAVNLMVNGSLFRQQNKSVESQWEWLKDKLREYINEESQIQREREIQIEKH